MKKRFFSILLALALCLTLLPGAVFAAGSDTSGHWAEETIAKWQQKGCVSGYSDGTFRPDSSITRAEFVKLFNRVLGLTAEAAISFTDVKESDWFYSEVAKAAAAGYASGSDGMFRPDAPITRAEAAVMLARALGLVDNEGRAEEFTDASAIPAWAKGSIGAVAEAGYMTGYPDGSFGAKDSITRAQTVVTLDRTQNVTVTASGTVLTDKTVAGDLIIAESVGEGEVTLKNVTVEGSLIIRGGGANSVYLNGVTVKGEVRLEKENLHLRLLGGTKLGTVVVVAKVKISGSGAIESLIVSVSGVTIDRDLTIRKTETADGAKAPTVYNRSSGSSSGGSSSGGSSSGGSSGGTTTKTITGVAAITPITVNYNTSKADALAKLPAEVTLNCSDGSTVTAAVTGWTVSGYEVEPRTTTDFTATAEVTVPDGCTNSGDTLTAEVTLTVRGGDKTIQSIVEPTTIEIKVANGTVEADAMQRLPSEVQLETYSPGTMVFAAVKWEIKDGQTYKPDTAATITYVGTVTIPDGYQRKGETTIEADIVVLPSSETATNKMVGNTYYTADVYVDKYTAIMSEIKRSLPDQIRLQCADGSWITGTIQDKTKWSDGYKSSSSDKPGYTKYDSFEYPVSGITLPTGYEFANSTFSQISPSVYVKEWDLEALQTALDAAWKQLDRMADTEEEALYFTEKVYIAPDGTATSTIATGAKFVYESEIKQAEKTLSDLISGKTTVEELCNTLNLLNQDAIDDKADKIITATAEVKAILDTAKTGTGYTQANILDNIRQWLDENSNYAYSEAMQPLTVEKHVANGIPLPKRATDIQINAAGDMADISLTWSIGDEAYAELKTSQDTGSQYVWVKGTATEPRDLSLTVKATTYRDANGNTVTLNAQVEAYNNLIVGAPIANDTDEATTGVISKEIAELTSGKKQTFNIKIPLQHNNSKIEKVTAATAECSDGSLTGSIAVDSVLPDGLDQRGEFSVLQAKLKATTQQLDAVVDTDKLEPAKVTLKIPYNAVTLTDWAIEQGWYVPKGGLTLQAEVKIHHPLVEITKVVPDGETEVRVTFDAKHSDSIIGKGVFMALVPSTQDTFTGKEAGSIVSDSGPVLTGDGNYDTTISISGITAGTEYTVWVKIDSDSKTWLKSKATYTYPTTSN